MKISYSVISALGIFAWWVASCNKAVEYEQKLKPEVSIVAGDARLQGDTVKFSADTVYVINVSIVRNADQVLEVQPGTLIKMADRTSIVIRAGGKIFAKGTKQSPIVFTSTAYTSGAGVIGSDGSGRHYWYGIRIFGDAASNPRSSAGTLNYVRIEFAGGDESFQGDPSLLFSNVGDGTSIDHIQVSYSFETPSFEFRGGNCQASHLLSYASSYHDFYIEGGYTGRLQFLFAYRHPYFPVPLVPLRLAGIYISGSASNPIISNATVLGPDMQNGMSLAYMERNPSASLVIAGGALFKIRNSVFAAFPKGGIYMNSQASARALNLRQSEFDYNYVHSSDSSRAFYLPAGVYPPFNSKDFRDFILAPPYSNKTTATLGELRFENLFEYERQLPTVGEGSPVRTGANFDQNGFEHPFFEKVTYIGSTISGEWWEGWSNITPLQTKYN